ncbi:MAG: RNA methyltransferase [Calditrichia bacterium]
MQVLQNRQHDLTVACENIHDPHNVSAILRSCDAVGVAEVYLLYNQDPFPQLGKKSSASALKWIDIHRYRDYTKLREDLHGKGYRIYATYIGAESESIYEIDWTEPAAIVMGNEHRGVSEEMREIADRFIRIPMFGMVQSLNVSVATAVILYEALRQRLQKGLYPAKNISESALKSELNKWLSQK